MTYISIRKRKEMEEKLYSTKQEILKTLHEIVARNGLSIRKGLIAYEIGYLINFRRFLLFPRKRFEEVIHVVVLDTMGFCLNLYDSKYLSIAEEIESKVKPLNDAWLDGYLHNTPPRKLEEEAGTKPKVEEKKVDQAKTRLEALEEELE